MQGIKKYVIFILVLSVSIAIGCNKDKTEKITELPDYCQDTVSFSMDVLPIFSTNCSTSGCHGQGASAGGYSFETYANIAADGEIALNAMREENGVQLMPFGGSPLADSITRKLECWLLKGKKNN